jgi:hydrogenase-4 component E
MPIDLFTRVVNLLAFVSLFTALLLIIRTSLSGQVFVFMVQSFVLALLAGTVAAFTGSVELAAVALGLAVIKGVIIPRVLNRAIGNIGLQRFASPYLSTPVSLVVCGILIAIAFYVMTPLVDSSRLPTSGGIPLAFACVLLGLFITVNRRRALTQILGFLALENGIFLLALLATYGVPFIVEIGVFLDVLVAVLIMEVFVYRIRENFDSIDVGQLGELKG